MELRLLRYFQAVAEELSFSKAAQKLRIAQPALSRAVRELEQELGADLLTRNKRSVKLTPAGSVLLNETGIILGLCDEAVRKVHRTVKGQEGELRLGYIGPPTQPFLTELLKEYRQRHPRVTVVLEERTPERVWEMVSKDRLDIGLTRPVAAGERIGLQTLRLRREAMCAVVPRAHELAKVAKVTWKMLQALPLITLARREGVGLYDAVMLGCHKAGFAPRLSHTPSIVSTVLTYVEAGAGVGVVPESISAFNNSSDLIFKPLHPVQPVELVMVWNADQNNPAAHAFRTLMTDWLARKNGKQPLVPAGR
ncbi:LysR substrate-binding domain-containing protein [Roseimicrobium sp. ORNL1]|uniref:LysR family transcriptional regulator n=1 Tax=Roseimicrobium sp. ORNL1 TaxID=2711231 RepID=UPI0013E1FAC6|nr:LysR substrate-binding domain-containing protein [Roseimicrobium sp. ORNL1]QIF00820.1 LysR family transcriptional regulator [Roseimicrobium sp. ORNL1]